MISKFGEYLRDFRKKNNESLRTMATKLGISAAFLSAMEVGRKLVPSEYADKIKEVYNLTETEYAELVKAIVYSNNRVNIELEEMNEAQKEISLSFARRIQNADQDLLEKLRKVLEDDQN